MNLMPMILFVVFLFGFIFCLLAAMHEYDYEEEKRTPKCRNYLIASLVSLCLWVLAVFNMFSY